MEKKNITAWIAVVVSILAIIGTLGVSVFTMGRGIEARPTKNGIEQRIKEGTISREEWGRICEALRQIEHRLERIERKIDGNGKPKP